MLLSEEAARTKWCPMVHARVTVVVDRDGAKSFQNSVEIANENMRFQRCIGSECAMWRNSGHKVDDKKTGYCGLAGIPEAI